MHRLTATFDFAQKVLADANAASCIVLANLLCFLDVGLIAKLVRQLATN
jgi:hypothetical protein